MTCAKADLHHRYAGSHAGAGYCLVVTSDAGRRSRTASVRKQEAPRKRARDGTRSEEAETGAQDPPHGVTVASINIPFHPRYERLALAYVAVLTCLNCWPCIIDDSRNEGRLTELVKLIKRCHLCLLYTSDAADDLL